MGWCSATEIFDVVAKEVLNGPNGEPEPCAARVLGALADELMDRDWDCEGDGNYTLHPVVRGVLEARGVDYSWVDNPEDEDG